ncbi:hypothetical protein BC831DRAFT_434466 [Entophlyctis helioformis]|nr:hypothetical protein BC831DRAFT_434466 [Entophlyctis helioformis]
MCHADEVTHEIDLADVGGFLVSLEAELFPLVELCSHAGKLVNEKPYEASTTMPMNGTPAANGDFLANRMPRLSSSFMAWLCCRCDVGVLSVPSSNAVQGYLLSLERAATVPAPKARENRLMSHMTAKSSFESNSTHLPPEYVSIAGYVASTSRLALFVLLSVLSLGTLPLFAKWKPWVWCAIARQRASAFRSAEYVLIGGPDGATTELPIVEANAFVGHSAARRLEVVRFFEFRKQRYVYQEAFSSFQRQNPRLLDPFAEIHNMRYGKSSEETSILLLNNGHNSIDIGSTPIVRLVLDKVLHPFYIFQFVSVVIWIVGAYTTYAILILVMSLVSIGWEVYTSKVNEIHLRSLTRSEAICPVLRDGVLKHIDASELVVGDAVILSASETPLGGTNVFCDMVLIQGECVMDESALTGETVPVVKIPLPFIPSDGANPDETILNSDRHKGHILFGGSRFGEIKPKKNWMLERAGASATDESEMAVAIVIATGFSSSKGELFRSILFPTHIDFKFNRDSYKFLCALGLVAFAAFLNRCITAASEGIKWTDAIISSLDLITIAVPPALPLILSVGTAFSLDRLKKSLVYCINPSRINFAGRIDVMCWDKTGTLTTPELHFAGIDAAERQTFKGFSRTLGNSLAAAEREGPGSDSNTRTDSEPVIAAVDGSQPPDQLLLDFSDGRMSIASRLQVVSQSSQSWQSPQRFGQIDDEPSSDDLPLITLETAMALCHGVVPDETGHLLGHALDIELVRCSGWMPVSNDSLDAFASSHSLPIVCAMVPAITDPASPASPGSPSANAVFVDGPSARPSAVNRPLAGPASISSSAMLILRRFDFDAHLQRSSVIATLGPDPRLPLHVITKGSPEAVRHACRSSSVPHNYFTVCQNYSVMGYYVIAVACRRLRSDELPKGTAAELASARREAMEHDLDFVGFLLFSNPLKDEAISTIQILREAHIRSVIITGDNALTAIHVARELELCKHAVLVDIHEQEVRFTEVPKVVPHYASAEKPPTSGVHERVDSGDDEDDDIGRSGLSLGGSNSRLTSGLNMGSAGNLATTSALLESADSFASFDGRRYRHIDDLIHQLPLMPAQTEIAITGAALALLCESSDIEFVDWIVGRARIFSRVKPDQKTWLIERLIKLGKYVGMCGDGTNDCGALKAAHVGMALSDAEASIVAPFTSARKQVSDAVQLVREGRCALETSFVAFKLMMSATLNQIGSALSSNQFLFDDLAIVTALALFMLYTKPSRVLVADRPTDDLFSPLVLVSILGQVAFSIGFFAINLAVTSNQPWFCSIATATSMLDDGFMPLNDTLSVKENYPCYPIDPSRDITQSVLIKSYENTSVWLYSHSMFAISSIVFTVTTHYRLPFWTNHIYTAYFAAISAVIVAMLLALTNPSTAIAPGPDEYTDTLSWIFNIQPGIPVSFRAFQVGLVALHAAIGLAWELFVVDVYVRRHVRATEMARQHAIDWRREQAVGIESAAAAAAEALDAGMRIDRRSRDASTQLAGSSRDMGLNRRVKSVGGGLGIQGPIDLVSGDVVIRVTGPGFDDDKAGESGFELANIESSPDSVDSSRSSGAVLVHGMEYKQR